MATSAPINETMLSSLWHIHIDTMTTDQRPYETALRTWLQVQGHILLARSDAPLLEKLNAARNCDVCLVLLGPTFGPCDSPLSFSHTELEVSSAINRHPDKILIFAQYDAETASSTEQREFINRMRDFTQGRFQAAAVTTPEEFVLQVKNALAEWQPPLPRQVRPPLTVPPNAVMISSTGDSEMRVKRDIVRMLLQEQQIPVIDYLHEQSESVTPIDRVISWAQGCRVLLLILGGRYGYISPVDGLGATELEFVTALRAGRPILAFIGSDAVQTVDSDQQQFVDRVCALLPSERVFFFQDVEDFTQQVTIEIDNMKKGFAFASYPLPAIPADLAQKWYRRQLQRWLGILPHLTQSKGLPLEDVFISLQVLPQEQRPLVEDERLAIRIESTRQGPIKPIEVDDALSQYSRLVLRGEAGTGKSVILRWYALTAPYEHVPILIRLASYGRDRQEGRVLNLFESIAAIEHRLLLMAYGGRTCQDSY